LEKLYILMNSLNINVCKVMKRKTLIEEDKKKIEISNKIDEIYLTKVSHPNK